ncbi:MAG: AAA ATPase midasin [Marteilia pararefringens]
MENDSLCKDIPEKPDLENYKIVNNRIQDLDLRNNYVEFETNGLVDDNIGFNISEENAKSLWIELSNEVINDSYLLGEKIKAYLQPNSMKRYKKGFKSGKKLNIQKLIQYVASNYQKDRIWMKRVRPTKLTYRTLLLMDDSLSMHHTQIKRDLLKSLCMISTAVTASSLGDLSICKFGNKFEIIVPFTQQLSEGDNIEIIRSLNFSQQSSELSSALRQLSDYILEGRNQSFDNLNNCDVNEIVFILTDGRNLGNSEFSSQIGNLINNHIAPLLIFLDLNQKESLENIQVPRFINGNQIIFDNYLSILPVPFYLLIKDIGQLSSAISECLTEWIGSFYG